MLCKTKSNEPTESDFQKVLKVDYLVKSNCNYMYSFLGYDSNKAYPLVFKAHGRGGDSDETMKYSEFAKIARIREDFILVAPDGFEKSWNVFNHPEEAYGKIQKEKKIFGTL